MTDEEQQIAELRRACGANEGKLLAKLAHVVNNPNHALLLNISLLRNVWSDLAPLLEEHAQKDPHLQLAGVPWAEMRQVIPRILDESLECARRIRRVIAGLRDGADAPSDAP